MSTFLGENNQIAIPTNKQQMKLTSFKSILERFLHNKGFKIRICKSEDEARFICSREDFNSGWPVFIFESNTTGEKSFEEFHSKYEKIVNTRFKDLGFIQFNPSKPERDINNFINRIMAVDISLSNAKQHLINEFSDFLENFDHLETHNYLNNRM